ncbi:hypothetical protein PVAND_010770 [Polypedilum vanderplanki]|uniref:Uncharacterized protein n=1 Tax=Polypedilum vanderplanki TaxID=319348 RepID=A0A9J6CGK2_POLVA|nr:hypothetical protein PVAND_010770 [Polypedilum vanderplanki]
MQNLNCGNKMATTYNQSGEVKKEMPKPKKICILKPETLIINIESAQQVCFRNLPNINEQQKMQRPMIKKTPIKSHKQQNQCLMPINEYLKLTENQNGKMHQCQQKNNQSTPLVRPRTVPDPKFCTISCNDYIKLVEGKPNQINHSNFSSHQPIEPKKEYQCPYMDLNSLENDRWTSTYQFNYTWKNNE